MAVVKNSIAASSSKDGEFETSMTTEAPSSASESPSPVRVLTPESGDAATTSWSSSRRPATTFEPIRPVPPMTTIFMMFLSLLQDSGWLGEAPDERERLLGHLAPAVVDGQ